MPGSAQREYSGSFPSNWAGSPNPITPRSLEASRPPERNQAQAIAAENVISQDSTQPEPKHSTPSTKRTEPGDSKRASKTRVRPKSPDDPEYSTVYPSSWSITSSGQAAVPLPHISAPAKRTESSTSQGDAFPMSPVRRRLQKQFWSLSIPRDKPQMKKRSESLIHEGYFRSRLGRTLESEQPLRGPPPSKYAHSVPPPKTVGANSLASHGRQPSRPPRDSLLQSTEPSVSGTSDADCVTRGISLASSSYEF
ncbi:hypothetical protein FGG08_005576 [Glutinoglossum americanum]|uniref:Uncharacterized protein n=1 Tax=Glutinoglossum americanum TaxID=1670608 RepID=A0A9P8L1Q5_9PEZI|nr:hypothetical protein FGG08_005576 [Glutinoglossum americanum]